MFIPSPIESALEVGINGISGAISQSKFPHKRVYNPKFPAVSDFNSPKLDLNCGSPYVELG